MNLIENYIKEIYSETQSLIDGVECVSVYVRVDCYGCSQKVHDVFEKEEWESIKKQGYFMG